LRKNRGGRLPPVRCPAAPGVSSAVSAWPSGDHGWLSVPGISARCRPLPRQALAFGQYPSEGLIDLVVGGELERLSHRLCVEAEGKRLEGNVVLKPDALAFEVVAEKGVKLPV